MVDAAAAVLFGLFLALRRNPAWRQLAVWLRSTAAAVLLFACAASGGLPGLGLQWLTAPLPALSLLLAGVGVNLFVAYAGGTATFASLHVVLSLIPLAIMPQSDISLILAAVVIACGIGLAFRGRWDIHLAVTLAASAAYQYFWYLGMAATATDQDWKMIGAGCAIAIAAAAALVHYRADYSSRGFEPLPFAVHAGNWSLFGLMLLIYRSGTYLGVIVLTAAGVASFLLARRGRTLHI
ncbi:MAG TPA: hypothetical protein VJN91_09375, partial [Gammaproteobacteria bacterium]|nr:hypothetical protein [Gammaproteobacteria bacterium]